MILRGPKYHFPTIFSPVLNLPESKRAEPVALPAFYDPISAYLGSKRLVIAASPSAAARKTSKDA